jgi:hypothetical protein
MCVEYVLTVRTSRCAAVGVVTKLVDVHATFSIGVIASDVPCDGGWGGLGGLLEGNGPSDLRVSSDSSNYDGQKRSARIRRQYWKLPDGMPK